MRPGLFAVFVLLGLVSVCCAVEKSLQHGTAGISLDTDESLSEVVVSNQGAVDNHDIDVVALHDVPRGSQTGGRFGPAHQAVDAERG